MLQDIGSLEGHDPTRRNRHFLAGLRVTSDTLVFRADLEGREGGKLYDLAANDRVADLINYCLYELRRLSPGEPNLAKYRFRQVCTRHCLSGHDPRPVCKLISSKPHKTILLGDQGQAPVANQLFVPEGRGIPTSEREQNPR
ncbi:hypothetical protein D3C87_1677930 [compost metagenome]